MLLKLNSENVVEYKVFDYENDNEEDYLLWLKQSKYGIWWVVMKVKGLH